MVRRLWQPYDVVQRKKWQMPFCGFNYYPMYSLDLSKKISLAMQTRTKNGTRLPVNARYGYKKGKDGRLEVDPEAAKVVKMIF